jgi:hypothetical protein
MSIDTREERLAAPQHISAPIVVKYITNLQLLGLL